MSHSIAFLAGVGARAPGHAQCDNPYPHSDPDGLGDFNNGYAAPPIRDEAQCSGCEHLMDGDDADELQELREDMISARHDLAVAMGAHKGTPLNDLVAMAVTKLTLQTEAA